jgi:hypothetical protein
VWEADSPLAGFPAVERALTSDEPSSDGEGIADAGLGGSRFRLVERYCPDCARLLEVDRIMIEEDT